MPAQLLPEPVRRSWERSRSAGVRPSDSPVFGYASRSVDAEIFEGERYFMQSVRDEVEQLWGSFGGPEWTIFCVNPRGVIVHARHSGVSVPAGLRAIRNGCRLLEADVGTTAPACALAEGATVTVLGSQHYLTEFESIFCLSTPFRDVDGEVAGALDITGVGERDMDLLGGYFRQAAFAIENAMFARLHGCYLVAIQHDMRWLNTPLQGLIAISEGGRLRAANSIGRRLLGLAPTGSVEGVTLASLFPHASPAQRRRLLQSASIPGRLPLPDRSHVFTHVIRGPLASTDRRNSLRWRPALTGGRTDSVREHEPGVLTAPPLREQVRDAVTHALEANGGNVALTARQLGISRTTLYKRLGRGRPAVRELPTEKGE
ncbi:transcriptional regulator of acetoin/glycerol metabolism [Luteibacter sp. Sphag1AF]|nr:transcriptional regulator of acetoin/glycerol metabolism [Luteibacter sp. Sphag1AF]